MNNPLNTHQNIYTQTEVASGNYSQTINICLAQDTTGLRTTNPQEITQDVHQTLHHRCARLETPNPPSETQPRHVPRRTRQRGMGPGSAPG